ncbi:hypothetical protein BO94DRAFT_463520, partial [Aspergillus sclerotioniger CBS 115572]
WLPIFTSIAVILAAKFISKVAEPLNASRTVCLPRLMPAPWVPIRPSSWSYPMIPAKGLLVSRNVPFESMPYIAGVALQFDLLKPNECQEISLRLRDDSGLDRGSDSLLAVQNWAPLRLIIIGSSLFTAGIVAWAVVLEDWPAVIAVVLISLASTLNGVASISKARSLDVQPCEPASDFVIRVPGEGFIVVHCDQKMTDLLSFDDVVYDQVFGETTYGILVLAAGLSSAVGMFFLYWCSQQTLLVMAAFYQLLCCLCLVCSQIPGTALSLHWDIQGLEMERMQTTIQWSYIESLRFASNALGRTDWILKGGFLPDTDPVRRWIYEAEKHLGDHEWHAAGAWNKCGV